MTNAHKLQSKVKVIRNTANWPSIQASYMIGSGTTIQENQQVAQIAARQNLFSDGGAIYCKYFGAGEY